MKGHYRYGRGFTLIEMIVALTILSLVVLATVTALRTLASTQATLNHRAEKTSEMSAVTRFLRYSFSQSVGILLAPIKFPGATYFEGTEHEVTWAAPMSIAGGAGGLSALKLYVSDEQQLILLMEPYSIDPQWQAVTPLVLVDEVQSFSVFYRLTGGGEWLTLWDPYLEKQSPSHIKIVIQANGRYWPEVIVALVGGNGGGL